MRLTRIELCGFKSFADKTTIHLSDGITAILGPNGCGKSNIVDAVKWVLGEQNPKSLRGGEMADVIFSGSENRKPMGFAEVNLYLDNSDGYLPTEYNELCIARRLYRSGESEYLINRQRCRLRDVRELFFDTGVGSNAYSVIEQGKVEALLAAKPEERRQVFEEAAGISKYKARRKECLSRLERTQGHLTRVQDILDEVERRVRSLSRQAQNARRYERLTDQLRQAKGHLYLIRARATTHHLTQLRSKCAELEELRDAEQSRITALTTQISQDHQQELAVEERLSESEGRLHEARTALADAEAENARLVERRRGLCREAEGTDEHVRALHEHLARIQEERAALEPEREALHVEVERVQAETDKAQQTSQAHASKVRSLEAEMEQVRTALDEVRAEEATLAATQARLDNEARNLGERADTLQTQIAAASKKEDALAKQLEDSRARQDTLATQKIDLDTQLEQAHHANADSHARLTEVDAALADLERECTACTSRRDTLRELRDTRAGVDPGVGACLAARREGRPECADVLGTVADLLRVEPTYVQAIEAALGGAQQYLVTSTARGARTTIEFLKREALGRATFLPLDNVRVEARGAPELTSRPGVKGEALAFVRFAEEHRAAAERLLAGVLVVETLDQALALRQEAGWRKIVTLDGECISRTGSLRGGRGRGSEAGLIARTSELEELSRRLETLEARRTQLSGARTQTAAECSERDSLVAELEQTQAERAEALREAATAFSTTSQGLGSVREEAARLRDEAASLSERLTQTRVNRTQVDEQARVLQDRHEQASRTVASLQQELGAFRQEHDQAQQALTDLKVRLAQSRQALEAADRRAEALARDARDRQQEAETSRQRGEQARQEHDRLGADLDTLHDHRTQLAHQCGQIEEDERGLRHELGELRSTLEERRNEERAMQRRLAEVNENLSGLRLDEREASLRLENLEQKVRDEVGPESLQALEATLSRSVDEEAESSQPEQELAALEPDALEKLVADLQERIRRIGAVNHQAVAELDELKARRDFLASERDDLVTARDDIQALINRLNEECTRRFDATFAQVREAFHAMFRRLFGGGRANLVLQQAEDPLEAGIEIVARPPGKELTTISLLSGGEKALCAVALLFSLFRCKPSPFCLLDEVDGPLDDSNIDLYMEAVRDFAQESQFVIITHNQRTMARTDRIWGVTQRERGVSVVYSLEFSAESGSPEVESTDTAQAGVA